MIPIARHGWTCNWDKYETSCKLGWTCNWDNYTKQQYQLRVEDGLAAGTTTQNYARSCESMVNLQLVQQQIYMPSCESKVDLQLGQLRNYDPSCESRVDLQLG